MPPEPVSIELVNQISDNAVAFKEARLAAWNEFTQEYGENPESILFKEFRASEKEVERQAIIELAGKLELKVTQVGRIWREAVPF